MFTTTKLRVLSNCLVLGILRQHVQFYKTRKNEIIAYQMKKWHAENKQLYGPPLRPEKKKTKKKASKKRSSKKTEMQFNFLDEVDLAGSSSQSSTVPELKQEDNGEALYWEESMPPSMKDLFDKSQFKDSPGIETSSLNQASQTDSFSASDFAFKVGKSADSTYPNKENHSYSLEEPHQSSSIDSRYVITDEDLKATSSPETKTNFGFQNRSENSNKAKKGINLSPLLEFPLVLPNKSVMKTAWKHISDFDKNFKENERFPSVSRILDVTKSPESVAILERWKKMMIAQLGEDGFKQFQEETFKKGRLLHSHIHDVLQGKVTVTDVQDSIEPQVEGHWASVQNVLKDVSHIELLETPIRHPYLRYAGIVDCVARYRDELCVIEWKTSKKPKRTLQDTFDNPVQVVAYMGAVNSSEDIENVIDRGLVVIAYENGDQADVHSMSHDQCYSWWNKWLTRVHQYWGRELKVNQE